MSELKQLYNYGGIVVYDGIFDSNEDIIISCLMSSPSGSFNLETEDNPLLITEDNKILSLNVPTDFDNFTVFLMDARVNALTGGGIYSSACETFTLSSTDNTPFSSAITMSRQSDNRIYSTFSYEYARNNQYWASRSNLNVNPFATDGTADGIAVVLNENTFFDGGWNICYNFGAGLVNLYTSGVSASNKNPWDVEHWYPTTSGSTAVARDRHPNFNTFIGPQSASIAGGFSNISSVSAYAKRFNNPGAGLIGIVSPDGGTLFSSLTNSFTALSGLMVLATYDKNGAFSLSGAMPQYVAHPANDGTNFGSVDYGSTEALTATENTFAVRVASPQYNGHTLANPTSSFPFQGSVTMPAPAYADNGNYEIFRVGFRRRLQEVVLYKKENNVYEPHGIIETGFPTNTRPTTGVRVGISYTGEMPFAIKNLTVNAVSGNAL